MLHMVAFSRIVVVAGSALLLLACGGMAWSGGKREPTLQLEYRLGATENPAEALLAARAVIEKRLAVAAPEARVLPAQPDRILVRVPEVDANTKAVLGKTMEMLGSLELRLVAPERSEAYKTWKESGKAPPGWTEYTVRQLVLEKHVERKVLVSDRCEMSEARITAARPVAADRRRLGPAVQLSFSAVGQSEFARITGDNVGEQLAIVLDTQRSPDGKIKSKGICWSAPVILARIFGDAVIDGDFTLQDAQAIAAALLSGCLPAPLTFDKATSLPTKPPRDSADRKSK